MQRVVCWCCKQVKDDLTATVATLCCLQSQFPRLHTHTHTRTCTRYLRTANSLRQLSGVALLRMQILQNYPLFMWHKRLLQHFCILLLAQPLLPQQFFCSNNTCTGYVCMHILATSSQNVNHLLVVVIIVLLFSWLLQCYRSA